MKKLLKLSALLLLISCGEITRPKEKYFTAQGSGVFCKKITHDFTLKECHYIMSGSPTGDIINATNITVRER